MWTSLILFKEHFYKRNLQKKTLRRVLVCLFVILASQVARDEIEFGLDQMS